MAFYLAAHLCLSFLRWMPATVVFVATGSASYDFYGGDRHGQNLFANCVIALNARTGERIWHYQTVHHDLWNRDLPSPPPVAERRVPASKLRGEQAWPTQPIPVKPPPFSRNRMTEADITIVPRKPMPT